MENEIKELMKILKEKINEKWDVYLIGLYNGLAISLGIITETEPVFFKSEVIEDD